THAEGIRMARALLSIAVLGLTSLPATADPPGRVDSVGDPLPAGAVVRFGTSRFQDFRYGNPVAFSPDGKQLATAAANGPLSIWDSATAKLLRADHTSGSIRDLVWRSDGRLVAVSYWSDRFWMNEPVDETGRPSDNRAVFGRLFRRGTKKDSLRGATKDF